MKVIIIFVAAVLFITIDAESPQIVTPAPLQMKLPFVSRWGRYAGWVDGGPCKRDDYKCMNAMSLKYVNEQRKRSGRRGLKPFKMGTMAMLKNAMAHDKQMKKRNRLYHQNLRRVKLGCSAFFSGENVAQTHCLLNKKGGPTDPAKMCSEQLRKSPPHYKNIISNYHRYFVMGVWVDPRGYIWCTQIFAVFARYGKGKCNMCSGGKKPKKKKPSKPKVIVKIKKVMMSSRGHVFKHKVFRDEYSDGYVEVYKLKCSYCASENGCLSEKESVRLDKQL